MHGTSWGVAKNVEALSSNKRPVVKGVVLVTSYHFLSVQTILPAGCHGGVKDAFISIFSGDTLAASPPLFLEHGLYSDFPGRVPSLSSNKERRRFRIQHPLRQAIYT